MFKKWERMARAKLGLVVMITSLLALTVVACGPASTPTQAPANEGSDKTITPNAQNSNTPTNIESEEPVLSDNLKRDCQFTPSLGNAGLVVGEIAVNFTLKDIHAREFSLSQLLAEKPVLMIFGSFT